MTREEAKQIFLNRGFVEVDGGSIFDGDKWRESCRVVSEWLEQEPCEDAVSRKAVAEIINRQRFGIAKISMGIIKEKIETLPSVTPTRKKAESEVSE